MLGRLVAWWGINALRTMELPVSVDFSLDYRVLVRRGASFVTGIAFGLAPAFTSTQIDLIPALRDDGGARSANRRWFTLKNGLVVLQVVLSVLLLSSAGVFVQMIFAARAQRSGFAIDGVAMLTTDARYAGYSAANATSVYQELRRRVASIPGVQSVGLTSGQPMTTNGLPIVVEQQNTPARVLVSSIWAGPGYFETLQMPILLGRAIDERDRADTVRVAVISESMARRRLATSTPSAGDSESTRILAGRGRVGTLGTPGQLISPATSPIPRRPR